MTKTTESLKPEPSLYVQFLRVREKELKSRISSLETAISESNAKIESLQAGIESLKSRSTKIEDAVRKIWQFVFPKKNEGGG